MTKSESTDLEKSKDTVIEEPTQRWGMHKASDSFNVRPMNIQGEMYSPDYRMSGMTDMERAWRRQWVKDQLLHPSEPVEPEGFYEARFNPLRRFFEWPMNKLYNNYVIPRIGYVRGSTIRYTLAYLGVLYFLNYWLHYSMEHSPMTWLSNKGVYVRYNRERILPGDPRWYIPAKEKKPSDYYDLGFSDSVLYKEQLKKLGGAD